MLFQDKVMLIITQSNINPLGSFTPNQPVKLAALNLLTLFCNISWSLYSSSQDDFESDLHKLTETRLCVYACMCSPCNCASASPLTAWLHGVEEGACQHCSPTLEQQAVGTAGYTVIMYHEEPYIIPHYDNVFAKTNKNSWYCASYTSFPCIWAPFWKTTTTKQKHPWRLICVILFKAGESQLWVTSVKSKLDEWHQRTKVRNCLWRFQSLSLLEEVDLFSFNYSTINEC